MKTRETKIEITMKRMEVNNTQLSLE